MEQRDYYYNPNRADDRRRNTASERRVFEVQKLNDLHHEITRRLLCGQKVKRIAEQLSCTPQTVSNVKNSKIVKDKLALMHGAKDANSVDLAKQIEELAPKALENLRQVIEDENEEIPIKMKADESNKLLDRAGYGATQKHESRYLHAHLTSDDVAMLKERARGAGVLIEQEEY